MKAFTLSALFFLGTMIATHAQVRFQAGPELGYALSTLPSRYTNTYSSGSITTIYRSLFNPMLGFRAGLLLGKHWMLGTSLQYQLAGTLDSDEGQGTNYWGQPYHSIYATRSRFHKLCLPLTINYSFRVGKFRPYIGIGYRAGAMVYALRTESVLHYYSTTSSTNSRDYRPLQQAFRPGYHPRRANQIMVCIGTQIGERLQVSVNAAGGMTKYYGLWDEDSNGNYVNGDIYFTAGYSLWNRQLKRRDSI